MYAANDTGFTTAPSIIRSPNGKEIGIISGGGDFGGSSFVT
jgi:hypothetical protein